MNKNKIIITFCVILLVVLVVLGTLVLLYLSKRECFYDFKDFDRCCLTTPKYWFSFSKMYEDSPKHLQVGRLKTNRIDQGLTNLFRKNANFQKSDFLTIGKGGVLSIRTNKIKEFKEFLFGGGLTETSIFPFVLISVDHDQGPSNFQTEILEILEHPKVIKVYIQNMDISHPKLEPLPIGVDYHTIFFGQPASFVWDSWLSRKNPFTQEKELFEVRRSLPVPSLRPPLAYTSATISMTDSKTTAFHKFSGLRKELKDREDEFKGVITFQKTPIKRVETWKRHGDFLFIVSPPGAGLDCHRTWEALALGNVPILFNVPPFTTSGLFDRLPVIFIQNLSEITLENMLKWKDDFVEKLNSNYYNFEKLTKKYWEDKILNELNPFLAKPVCE